MRLLWETIIFSKYKFHSGEVCEELANFAGHYTAKLSNVFEKPFYQRAPVILPQNLPKLAKVFCFAHVLVCDWTFDNCWNAEQCVLTSPGFPGLYPPYRRCRYLLNANQTTDSIRVHFNWLSLPPPP